MDVSARDTGGHRVLVYAAAGLSLLSALSHLWATPEHMQEWWGYGAFFAGVAAAQGLYAAALTAWPRRSLFGVGIVGNLAVLALYALTRTVGIPLLGPHAGEVEGFGLVGLCASAAELGTVLALVTLALWELPLERKLQVAVFFVAGALLVGHLVHLFAEGATGHGP